MLSGQRVRRGLESDGTKDGLGGGWAESKASAAAGVTVRSCRAFCRTPRTLRAPPSRSISAMVSA